MNSSLLGITGIGILCSLIAIYYITRIKSSFDRLPRLQKPWILLEVGVTSLLLAIITIPIDDLSLIVYSIHFVQLALVVSAAFFILTAMVTMKQAWTIGERE